MVSFVNSAKNTETDQDNTPFEVIFCNEALSNMLNTNDLTAMLYKQLFVNTELGTPMSLVTAAQNRFSNVILSQVHRFSIPPEPQPNE